MREQIQGLLDQRSVEAADALRILFCRSDKAREDGRAMAEESKERRGEAREHHGLLCWALGRSTQAAGALEGAEAPHLAYALGRSLQELGRHADAASALKRAARSEKNLAARWALLRSRVAIGESAEVLKEVQALLKEGHDTADAHDVLGEALEAEGEHQQAVEAWQTAQARDPSHARSLFNLALHADLRGLDDEALELYERASRLDPAHAGVFVNLGVLYEDRAEFDKAASCYRIVVDADPDDEKARLYLKDAESSQHMYYDEEMEKIVDERRQILAMPITEFELSVRARNCLKKMNVETLSDIVQLTEEQLLGFRNFGETSLREVKKLLADKGLRLGMRPEMILSYRPPVVTPEIMQKPILELHLSVRAHGAMEQLGVVTVGDLTRKTKAELGDARNFGRTSLKEVMDKLAELGLALADG